MTNLDGFLAQVLASLTASGLLTAAMIWLAKSAIAERLKNAIGNEYASKLEIHKAYLATTLETHKCQLQAQAGLELERAKSEMSLEAKKQELLFSRMQERRAESIARTFDELSTLYTAMQNYTQMFEHVGIMPRDERRNIAAAAYNNFHGHFVSSRIFLPKDTADRVAYVDDEIRKLFNQFVFMVDLADARGTDTAQSWLQISEKLEKDIQATLRDIEDHFRELIAGT